MEYVNKKIQLDNLLKNQYKNECFRKVKWYSYINKQRHEDNLMNDIECKFGKDIMIIIGDWNETEGIKYMSTPNISLKRKLKLKFENVFLLDEFRTSKLWYKNSTIESEHISINYRKNGKVVSKELHSVLTFKMENKCMECINRDLNAVLNYEKIIKNLIETGKRPKEFTRSKTIRPD
jgi:hypothetical protein